MFSEQLIDQLSQIIIRPHREIYGLDRLGPRKLIIKNISSGTYIEAYRTECTILSGGKKLQMSIFQPFGKPSSSPSIIHTLSHHNKSLKNVEELRSTSQPQVTIFLHSNSGSRLEGLQYAKFLLQYGQIVCVFDYSGSGVSEGQYVTMGMNEAKDLNSVIGQLKSRYGISQFNLWGRSMGAVTAILYASKNPESVKKMVLDSPFCNFRQLVKEIVNARTGLPEFLFGSVLDKIEQNIVNKTSGNLMDIDLKKSITRYGVENIPCLFLISKDDKLVNPAHVETLYQTHQGVKKILYLEGSHNKPRPTEIREKCAEFLCKELHKVGSVKKIEKPKKAFLQMMSRKFSQNGPSQGRPKMVSTSLIFQEDPDKNQLLVSYASTQLESSPMPSLNIAPNGRSQVHQSSLANTHREEQSSGKVCNGKISLSQVKKNQFRPMQQHTFGKQKLQSEYKRHSRTMAIQYKNKIKQYINQN